MSTLSFKQTNNIYTKMCRLYLIEFKYCYWRELKKVEKIIIRQLFNQ